MNPLIFYQIVRSWSQAKISVPYAVGHYRLNGEFVQVFPVKQIFKDKDVWCKTWYIFGDEQVVTYVRRHDLPVLSR